MSRAEVLRAYVDCRCHSGCHCLEDGAKAMADEIVRLRAELLRRDKAQWDADIASIGKGQYRGVAE
jgi:hypothetical protein